MSHTWAVDKGPGFYRHSFTTKRRLPVPIYFSGAGPWVAYVW
jgi:hypothetical protein